MSKKPWSAEEENKLKIFRGHGYTIGQCAKLMNRGRSTIQRHLGTKTPRKRWSEEEKEKAIYLKAMGKSYAYIAKKLGRSKNAVEIFFCRYRKEVMSDPEKVKVLKVLSFCLNPGRVLRYLRDIDILKRLED